VVWGRKPFSFDRKEIIMAKNNKRYELRLQEEMRRRGFTFSLPELRVVIELLDRKIDMDKVAEVVKRFNSTHTIHGFEVKRGEDPSVRDKADWRDDGF
jgi:hypothetical protein